MLCANSVAVPLETGFFPELHEVQERHAEVRIHAPRQVLAKLSGPDDDDRAALETFVRDVFAQAYGARIKHFLPQLMSMRDLQGRLLAVCGLRHADSGRLFLETYLEAPVEALIAAHVGEPVARRHIVEIGNLAVADPGEVRQLLASLSAYLHSTQTEWAVFTATPLLRNSLQRLNMPLQMLAQASLEKIAPAERPDWGSYYDKTPHGHGVAAFLPAAQRTARHDGPMTHDSRVIAALHRHAAAAPASIALTGVDRTVSYAELAASVTQAADHFRETAARIVGLALDNGPAWAAIDLAALQSGTPIVPLPTFFSDAQIRHAMLDAGVDRLLTDQPERFERLCAAAGLTLAAKYACEMHGQAVYEMRLSGVPAATLPAGTAKITYTSGTTGTPKGVCLGAAALEQVAISLQQATGAAPQDRHQHLLPLSTLLENLAGLYVPLLAGAGSVALPLALVGLQGASRLDVPAMLAALNARGATTTILTPEMLLALVVAAEQGYPIPRSLRFVAVGGAPVAVRLLQRAHAAGIPAYEGYGLSECASVVALNTPAAAENGSVGRPLPHVKLKFAEDGEILVAGSTLLGYTGKHVAAVGEYWPTGDRGYLDQHGYLHISGRKKNIFITSFGRNVSPEWVERELTIHPAIAQAAVFGEARPWNVAVIVPRSLGAGVASQLDDAIAGANRLLPDYARVRLSIIAESPFTAANGLATANGRLKREAIFEQYRNQIEQLYEDSIHAVL